jgi:hypothetical protein
MPNFSRPKIVEPVETRDMIVQDLRLYLDKFANHVKELLSNEAKNGAISGTAVHAKSA